MRSVRSSRRFSLPAAFLAVVCVCVSLLFAAALGPAAAASKPFSFENADIQTVVKQVAALTGITFLFDPERVKGKITLVSPKGGVSPADALDLLKSALALHGYTLLSRGRATWIVPAPDGGFTIEVLPLRYAWAGELAYTLSWIAPPSVRIVPYYPTNSLVISGDPAAVEALIGVIR